MTADVLRRDRKVLWIAVAIYAAVSLWMAAASNGFLEADGITHYLARRFALADSTYFVGVWSRPLCVLLYCIPSRFGGLLATRAESLVLVLLTLPLVVASARRLGLRRPAWAGLFLLTQPLLFAHSFSELTEVPFALLLAAAFYAYQRRWFGVMAVLLAISPLGRPEGFGLLLVAAVALVLHRKWQWLAVLPMGVAGWCWVGWHVYGGPKDYAWWQWLGHSWPYSPTSVYGSGSVATFVRILPAVVGPIAFGFTAFGIARLLRLGRQPAGAVTRFFVSHRARCRVITIAAPLGVLAVHTLLWATGKMASNGEPRYLLVAAPFWAMLAAAGLETLATRFAWRRPTRFIAINALLAVAANLIFPVFPLGPQGDDRLAGEVAAWIQEHAELRTRYPKFYTWQPHLFFMLDIDKQDSRLGGEMSRAETQAVPNGSMMAWDSIYAVTNSSTDYVVTQKTLVDSGWRPLANFEVHGHTAVLYVSAKDRDGRE